MRVVITGATGFIGKYLCKELTAAGCEVIALSRNPQKARSVLGETASGLAWDGRTVGEWGGLVDGAEAVINLAGENLTGGRWTESFKRRIIESRVNAGKAVTEAIRQAKQKPKMLLQASGVGYYGSRGEENLNEYSDAGAGFLAQVVEQWEESVREVEREGVRTVYLRTGVVLGRGEGMIGKMLLPFKLFVGGAPGSGRQWLSWIHIADVSSVIRFLMAQEKLKGVFNLVAPQPVRMSEFAKAFGKTLKRPWWTPIPSPALRVVFGSEMAGQTLLVSQRVTPKRLCEAGYRFLFPELGPALDDLLG